MRIDLDKIDREQFMVHEHMVAGEPCYLVQPQHIGAQWDEDNLIYRSSLWSAQGEPVSLSYKKHFNWDEKPDIDPAPTSLEGAELMQKIDGSTLLISAYNGELIIRTRGTVDATKMDNGDEIALFKTRYPALFVPYHYSSGPMSGPHRHITMALEWVSPRNQIVIPYPEPDLYLTGVINHDDYSYWSQNDLDWLAPILGLKRPRRYSFDSVKDMLAAVNDFKGVEGICVYYNRGQSWRKTKASAYLVAHRLKSVMSTLNHVLDYWFTLIPRPTTLEAFFAEMEKATDHEIAKMATLHMSRILWADRVVQRGLDMTRYLVEPLKSLSRRDAALDIQAKHDKHYQAVAFTYLSGREIDDKQRRKLMEVALEDYDSP